MKYMETKHIQNVTETDNSVTITFEKNNDANDKGNSKTSSIETTISSVPEEKKASVKEEKNNKIEEKMITQKSDKQKLYRVFGFNKKEVSADKREQYCVS